MVSCGLTEIDTGPSPPPAVPQVTATTSIQLTSCLETGHRKLLAPYWFDIYFRPLLRLPFTLRFAVAPLLVLVARKRGLLKCAASPAHKDSTGTVLTKQHKRFIIELSAAAAAAAVPAAT